MTDDGFGKGEHPDNSHSDYNDVESTPERPDSNSGQRHDDEPTQELSQGRDTTQQFSMNPDASQYQYDNQQYPQQSDYQNAPYPQGWNQYPQNWNQYPQSGEGWRSQNAAGWAQQAGQYAQYPQQGWDGQNPQQGWNPNQYAQQGWGGQPGDGAQGTPPAGFDQGSIAHPQNNPSYYFDSAGQRGPGWYGPYGEFFPAADAPGPDGQPDPNAYLAEGAPAGATAADPENVSESVGGIPFSDAPQPKRKSQYWIIAVAAILVVALGVGTYFYLRSKSESTKAVPVPASKTSSSASGTLTPTPDLVRQLFNAPDAQVQWVSLAADGQNAAVAYASTFNINGKSAGPNGGHLVMRKNGSHWEPLSQGGVIVDDSDCDAMLKTLGNKAAVAASQVMNNKQCDPAIVYDLAKASPIRLGDMAGIGPLNLDKDTSELASTIHVIAQQHRRYLHT